MVEGEVMRVRLMVAAGAVALTAGGVVAGVTAVSAGSSSGSSTVVAAQAAAFSARCHAHQVGSHWSCVTPGSYCPAAAHGHYGYAYKTGRRYRCSYYSSDGRWHWKRAY